MRRFEASVVVRGADPPLPPGQARSLLQALARRLNVRHSSVALVFGPDELLRDLNRRYRGRNRPTDVLSFPGGGPPMAPGGENHLGDIVVSSPTARRQSRGRPGGAPREARVLLIHGFLHLLGYDHEVDDGQMEALERTLRWELIPR